MDVTWSQPTGFGHGWEYLAEIWAPGLTLGGVSGWRPPYISIAAGGGAVYRSVRRLQHGYRTDLP